MTITNSYAKSCEIYFPEYLEQLDTYQSLKIAAGLFHVEIDPTVTSSTCNLNNRCIALAPHLFDVKIEKIFPKAVAAVVFEMANLAQSNAFRKLIERIEDLTPNEFVETYERIEHKSALKAKEILRATFPPEQWDSTPIVYCPDQFQPHYLLQQVLGHSQKIWERYSRLKSDKLNYPGTWDPPLDNEEKQMLKALLHLYALKHDPLKTLSEMGTQKYEKLTNLILSKKDVEPFARLAQRIQEIAF